jgi:hypothetical protein
VFPSDSAARTQEEGLRTRPGSEYTLPRRGCRCGLEEEAALIASSGCDHWEELGRLVTRPKGLREMLSRSATACISSR